MSNYVLTCNNMIYLLIIFCYINLKVVIKITAAGVLTTLQQGFSKQQIKHLKKYSIVLNSVCTGLNLFRLVTTKAHREYIRITSACMCCVSWFGLHYKCKTNASLKWLEDDELIWKKFIWTTRCVLPSCVVWKRSEKVLNWTYLYL